ncbi:MAG: hypothetical protein WA709_21755, partial [Stellaceae bacterium]
MIDPSIFSNSWQCRSRAENTVLDVDSEELVTGGVETFFEKIRASGMRVSMQDLSVVLTDTDVVPGEVY